jgi:hypothetical protein
MITQAAQTIQRDISVFIITLIISCLTAKGQTFISTDPAYLLAKPEGNNRATSYERAYPDTSIHLLSEFFPRNFSGNHGLPSPQYEPKFGTDDLGFRLNRLPYDNHRFRAADASYYRSRGPFAQLTGVAGSRELQVYKAFYTQTFRKSVNIALRFNRYTSKGFYQKQQTYTNNFLFTSNYASGQGRWGYYFYLLNNGNRHQENGGIRDERLNDSTMLVRKELMPVRISNASRDNRQTAVMFNPWLRLSGNAGSGTEGHFLHLKSSASFSSLRYRDLGFVTDRYYMFVHLDTTKTLDSTNLRQFLNEAGYTWKSLRHSVSVSYRNGFNMLWQQVYSVIMNHFAIGEICLRPLKRMRDTIVSYPLESKLNMQYALQGPAAGNYKLESRSFYALNGSAKLFLDLLYENRNADYIYNNWLSNHFYWWNNGFSTQQRLQAAAGLRSRRFEISGFSEKFNNFLYFDELALPRQLDGDVTNTGIKAAVSGIFFRHLGLHVSNVYQFSSRPGFVRLPPNVFSGRLFYNGMLFRNNLQLQLGAQLQVYDSFYPYAYMPATQALHLQTTFSTEPYPFVDFFLQGRIRPVSFFLKIENILHGYAGSNYSLLRHYYQPDRAFRMGISWMFFD